MGEFQNLHVHLDLVFHNNMLKTGMVPALYEQDEKDALCNTVKNEVRAAGIPETSDNLWSWYRWACFR